MPRNSNLSMTEAFDKQRLIQLIRTAVESAGSHKDFSLTSGISLSHLSRLYNGNFNSPPNKSTLRKIASCVAGGPRYEDLLQAAGYKTESLESQKGPDNNSVVYHYVPQYPFAAETPAFEYAESDARHLSRPFEDAIGTVFRRELEERGIPWEIKAEDSHHNLFDYHIHILMDSEIDHWYIDTKYFSSSARPGIIYQPLALALTIDPRRSKFSLVTNDLRPLRRFLGQHFYTSLLMSCIWVDTDNWSVREEIYLDTDAVLPANLSRYSICEHYLLAKEMNYHERFLDSRH